MINFTDVSHCVFVTIKAQYCLGVARRGGIEVRSDPLEPVLIRVVLDAAIVKQGMKFAEYRRWVTVEGCGGMPSVANDYLKVTGGEFCGCIRSDSTPRSL